VRPIKKIARSILATITKTLNLRIISLTYFHLLLYQHRRSVLSIVALICPLAEQRAATLQPLGIELLVAIGKHLK
jgi:hypothetical protein